MALRSLHIECYLSNCLLKISAICNNIFAAYLSINI